MVSWPVPPEARSAARDGANNPSSHSNEAGGPMPPRVVNTMGRKARRSRVHPSRCLPSFSLARAEKMAVAEVAAACE